jgi:NACalpha-BTF3-like transcription factor
MSKQQKSPYFVRQAESPASKKATERETITQEDIELERARSSEEKEIALLANSHMWIGEWTVGW